MGILSDVYRPIRELQNESDKAVHDSYRKAIATLIHRVDKLAFDLSIHVVSEHLKGNKVLW